LYSLYLSECLFFNEGSPNSTKPTSALTDKDTTAAGVVNTVAGAAAPTTASPSHSLSPENVIILIMVFYFQ